MCFQEVCRYPRSRLGSGVAVIPNNRSALDVRRALLTGTYWRPWTSTGMKTVSNVLVVTVGWGKLGQHCLQRPICCYVEGTISGMEHYIGENGCLFVFSPKKYKHSLGRLHIYVLFVCNMRGDLTWPTVVTFTGYWPFCEKKTTLHKLTCFQ